MKVRCKCSISVPGECAKLVGVYPRTTVVRGRGLRLPGSLPLFLPRPRYDSVDMSASRVIRNLLPVIIVTGASTLRAKMYLMKKKDH